MYWSVRKEVSIPQLRQNIITGEWVVIAPERAKRPSDFIGRRETPRPEAEEDDVFRVGGEAWKTRYKEFDSELIYIIPNKYPAFIEDLGHISPRSHKVEHDFYRMRPAIGGHDVVVIKDPDGGPTKFSKETWFELLSAFRKRYNHFENISRNIYPMPIYNHKPEAAASIWHPHAQIFASPMVPNAVKNELDHSEKYFEYNGSNVFTDLANHEIKEKDRLLAETENFVAFTFYAARAPFETWILPKHTKPRFQDIANKEMQEFAGICKEVYGKLDDTLDDPPLNFYIHSAPNRHAKAEFYTWHMEIRPRIANYGGYELGSGMVIDIVSPENAARYLRAEDYE